ncbi:MAG: WG repeat-containing protein [Methylacidiphilales bacterium]|nr:WG repeat-containing protein [Candidatus Methylacidiphilales bacterium]
MTWNAITKLALLVVAATLLTGCSHFLDDCPDEPYGSPDVDQSILLKEGPNGKFGYVDRNGKWLIAPQFTDGTAFMDNIFDKHDGQARVQLVGGGDAYIDKSGKIVSRIP